MSANAVAACARDAARRLSSSPAGPGRGERGDRWTEVATIEEAVDALGAEPRSVFLTQGRLQLAAFRCARRSIAISCALSTRPAEIDALPRYKLILARGPFRSPTKQR